MSDRHDEFNQWLRNAYPSTWPDWSADAIMLARAAFRAQPRPRSMESAPRDGGEVHDWVDEDGFDVCSQCGSYANDKLTDVCDSTTTDEQVGE